MTTVHLEEVPIDGARFNPLICRLYYSGSFEELTPFDAVFFVVRRADHTAYMMGAHGKITVRAYGAIARKLHDEYGITRCDMQRHGKEISVDTARASGFGDL